MELKTDEFAWGVKTLFKTKKQANYIIAEKPTVIR